MYNSIAVLGSTGSVGTQTLDVADLLGVKVDALSADSNDKLIEEQARKFNPRIVALKNPKAAKRLKGGKKAVRQEETWDDEDFWE